MEVSPITGDATCPFCGALLWGEDRPTPDESQWATAQSNIRGRIAEITSFCATGADANQLLKGCLPRLVECLAALGGAIWLDPNGAKPSLITAHHLPPEASGPKHLKLFHASLLEPQIFPASHSERDESRQRYLLLFVPLLIARKQALAIEIVQRPVDNPVTQRGYIRFLTQMCDVIATAPALAGNVSL